jgi:hypothetical protein
LWSGFRLRTEKRHLISNEPSSQGSSGGGTAYRVVVVASRSKPKAGNCVSSKRNPTGGWDVVYVSGREHLREILAQSRGAAQVQVREHVIA